MASSLPEQSYTAGETYNIADNDLRISSPDQLGSRYWQAKYLRFYRVRTSAVGRLLAKHSTVVRVEFHDCTLPIDTIISGGSNEAELPSAREVVLVDTLIGDRVFQEMFLNLPALRTLVYYRPSNEPTHIDLVGQVMVRFGWKLEHLVLRNESLYPFEQSIDSLVRLRKLKTLEIDLEFLIGFRDIPARDFDEYMDSPFVNDEEEQDFDEIHESFGDWALVDLLPTSLEKLTLHIDYPKLNVYFNTYERYGAKFEQLLRAEARFRKLEFIEAPDIAGVLSGLDRSIADNWIPEGRSVIRRIPFANLSLDDPFTDTDAGPSGQLPNGVPPTTTSSASSACPEQTMEDAVEEA
ncbi:hypothetical protein GGR55DRAFT_510962 [Xylaria sp. FL0064]|nr:hypothetical protein GGR55DRAFT_510962 [Xylaria sp. FL0064]